MTIQEEKRALRRAMRAQKATLGAAAAAQEAAWVFEALEALPAFEAAKTVLAYWSLADELPTEAFVEGLCGRKRVLLPVVRGADLELREYRGRENMQPVPPFGILEPQGTPVVPPGEVDLVVVPGVAFDRAGGRLGRGKGFYDRLFPTMPGATLVGVCFGLQVVESVPREAHDRVMDCVLFRPSGAQ